MQVARQEDHVTHAVVGGEQTIDFGISQDASFLFMLSSNLYKNQKLAVVRETMCNAWDAHIDAGLDNPIRVYFEENHLVIQDFGKGIHKDKIGPIYGTYGNSTKQHDGKQTGGFGLGCKSPFAYTEHFEVTSCHEGTKTIYTMSKSSAQVGGKPGITPIVSMPTTETGIKVRIPMKPGDQANFRHLVTKCAYLGAIPTHLGKETLEVVNMLPYADCESNYLLAKTTDDLMEEDVYIKYGNVLYPLSSTVGMEPEMKKTKQILNATQSRNYGTSPHTLILMAPPHSISITPSREEMSMTAQTIGTVKTLLQNFVSEVNRVENKLRPTFYPKQLDWLRKSKDHESIMAPHYGLFASAHSVSMDDSHIKSTDILGATLAIRSNRRESKSEFKDRLYSLVQDNVVERSMVQSYVNYKLKFGSADDRWFTRKVAWPLIQKVGATEGLRSDRLYVRDRQQEYSRHSEDYITTARRVSMNHSNAINYLKKRVVITSMKTKHRKGIPNAFDDHYFLYVIAPNDKQYKAALDFFTNEGFEIYDHFNKNREKPVRVPRPKPVPRREGHVSLADCMVASMGGVGLDLRRCVGFTGVGSSAMDYVTEPKAFLTSYTSRGGSRTADRFADLYPSTCEKIANLFGKDIAVIASSPTAAKLRNNEVPYVLDYVLTEVVARIKANPRFEVYAESNVMSWVAGGWENQLSKFMLKEGFVKRIYPHVELNDKEYLLWQLFMDMCNAYHQFADYNIVELKKLYAHIKAIKPNRDVRKAVGLVSKNPYLGILSQEEMFSLLKDKKHGSKARRILEGLINL